MNDELTTTIISKSSPLHFSYKQGVINPINRITKEEFVSGKNLITDSDILYIVEDYKSDENGITPAFFIGDGKSTFGDIEVSFWMNSTDQIKSEKCIGYAGDVLNNLLVYPYTNPITMVDKENKGILITPTIGMFVRYSGRLYCWDGMMWEKIDSGDPMIIYFGEGMMKIYDYHPSLS